MGSTAAIFQSMSTTHKEIGSPGSQNSGCTSLYLGSQHDASIHDVSTGLDSTSSEPSLLWYKIRAYGRDAFSEFFGTMILILFGDGVVAQVLLSHGEKGDYQSISWGWG
jgi:aquaglyceroporin related protein